MSKDEKKETVERIAKKLTGLEENDKSFIVGYMVRAEEERKEKEGKEAVATV